MKLSDTGQQSTKKHQNEIDKVWNKERKCVYQELIEKEVKEQGHAIHGNATFPMVLREHLTVIYT